MLRKIAPLALLAILGLSVGCTLPCHPFDYNGPVYDSAGNCISNNRAGSILEDGQVQYESVPVAQEAIEEPASDNYQGQYTPGQPGDYEGATKILSVTDRKVDETGPSDESQPRQLMAQPATKTYR